MDSKTKYTYANLFNLEPLMDFQLPKQDEDSDCFESSSPDESKGNQGEAIGGHTNGIMSDRRLRKKKRSSMYGSEDEETSNYSPYISEERYRTMLGDHIQKYRGRVNKSSQSPASAKTGTPVMKSGLRLKDQKITGDSRVGLHKLEQASDFLNIGSQKLGNYLKSDIGLQHGAARINLEPSFLDIGDGITYRIPLPYEKLSPSLNLPSMSDIRVEEFYLKGTLDLGSLVAMMALDSRFRQRSGARMGDSKPQFESLQAKLKAQSGHNSAEIFCLKISEAALQSNGIPEGAAGGIRRSILSDGVLQVYYVKVLERRDTYEIIERSLPRKTEMKKESSVIEREEIEKTEILA